MPRAKPIRNSTPRVAPTRICLSSADQLDLICILNLEQPRLKNRRQTALRDVEETLSIYPALPFDHGPRPANMLKEMEPLIRSTKQTYRLLSELSLPAKNNILQAGSPNIAWGPFGDPPPEVQQTINANRFLLSRLKNDLPALAERLALAKDELASRVSKPGNTKLGLRLTVLCLAACFKRHYRPTREHREKDARTEFIRRALKVLELKGVIKHRVRNPRRQLAYLLRKTN